MLRVEGFISTFSKMIDAIKTNNVKAFKELLNTKIMVEPGDDAQLQPIEDLLFDNTNNRYIENNDGVDTNIIMNDKINELLNCMLEYSAISIIKFVFDPSTSDETKINYTIKIPDSVIEMYVIKSNEYVMSMLGGLNIHLYSKEIFDKPGMGILEPKLIYDLVDPILLGRDPCHCAFEFFKKHAFDNLLVKTKNETKLKTILLQSKYLSSQDQLDLIIFCHQTIMNQISVATKTFKMEMTPSKTLTLLSQCHILLQNLSHIHSHKYISQIQKDYDTKEIEKSFMPAFKSVLIATTKIFEKNLITMLSVITLHAESDGQFFSEERKKLFMNMKVKIEEELKKYSGDSVANNFAKIKMVVETIADTYNNLNSKSTDAQSLLCIVLGFEPYVVLENRSATVVAANYSPEFLMLEELVNHYLPQQVQATTEKNNTPQKN